MNEEYEKMAIIGRQIIQVLGLKLVDGKVNTTYGTKTPVGLVKTIKRLTDEQD